MVLLTNLRCEHVSESLRKDSVFKDHRQTRRQQRCIRISRCSLRQYFFQGSIANLQHPIPQLHQRNCPVLAVAQMSLCETPISASCCCVGNEKRWYRPLQRRISPHGARAQIVLQKQINTDKQWIKCVSFYWHHVNQNISECLGPQVLLSELESRVACSRMSDF